MGDIPYMDLNQFVQEGWLQEVNRQFFHPRGLALVVNVDDDGNVTEITGVWDDRTDPDGWYFSTNPEHGGRFSIDKTVVPEQELELRRANREKLFGQPVVIQPLDWSSEELEADLAVTTIEGIEGL